ncbi:MAG: response regulator transcription factor [Lachnospiraceae bacterium]|nr:response regulator transcription factor [Lachnospiraceae bacterium]
MFTIMVVEDDKELCDLFCSVLSENGFSVLPAADGEQALKILEHEYVDLLICDVMMPCMDGYELTKALRDANYMIPILMITARDGILDKKKGFLSGIDDYMVKPVDVNEMLWRVNALLRRSQIIASRKLQIGSTVLDCNALTVTEGNHSTELPQKEFYLLFKLLSSAGKIFTRRQLIDEIWGIDFDGDPHTLEVHISRLREKFRHNSDFEIVTIRGLGYKAVKGVSK